MGTLSILKQELNKCCPQFELREQEPLYKHTAFRIGGPATLMGFPKTEEEAVQALRIATALGITPVFWGRGSNVLVADEGIDAFVLKSAGGLEELRLENAETLSVGSGVLLAQAAVFAMEHGLSGLEFAHGIPGSMGGAVFMNAGAYGGEMAQVVTEVTYLTTEGIYETLCGAQLDFGYRHSAFSDGTRFILRAKLHLYPGEPEDIQLKMSELMQKRKTKQPLEYPSAGSTFKRPKGYFAGSLIEQCGLKGRRLGGAQVSEKHAGFIINTGHASCSDVLGLIKEVREIVFRETGVTLEPEVRMLGCHL